MIGWLLFWPSTLSLQMKFLSDSLATEGNGDPVFGQPLIRKLFHLVTQDSCAVTGVTALDILIAQAKTNTDNFLSLVKGQSILYFFELKASPALGQNVYTDLWAEKWAGLFLLCHCRQGPCHERLEHWRKVMESYRLPALQVAYKNSISFHTLRGIIRKVTHLFAVSYWERRQVYGLSRRSHNGFVGISGRWEIVPNWNSADPWDSGQALCQAIECGK